MANAETPTEQILKMQKEGRSDAEIITALTSQGLKPAQISEALNQAKIKAAVTAPAPSAKTVLTATAPSEGLAPSILSKGAPSEEFEVPAPSKVSEEMPAEYYEYPAAEAGAPGIDTETIEEIAEEIVNEKWAEAKAKISAVAEWKDYTEERLKSMDEKMRRIEKALDGLQAALLDKVAEYGKNIKNLGTEMQSLEGAFSKVLSPLVANIKELQTLTGKLGKGRKGKGEDKASKKKKKK